MANGLLNNLIGYWGLDEAGGEPRIERVDLEDAIRGLDPIGILLAALRDQGQGGDRVGTGLHQQAERFTDGLPAEVSDSLLELGISNATGDCRTTHPRLGGRLLLSATCRQSRSDYVVLVCMHHRVSPRIG